MTEADENYPISGADLHWLIREVEAAHRDSHARSGQSPGSQYEPGGAPCLPPNIPASTATAGVTGHSGGGYENAAKPLDTDEMRYNPIPSVDAEYWRNQRAQERASNTVTKREPAPWNRMLIVGAIACLIVFAAEVWGWM